jgi:hypothetical protein
VLIGRLLLLNPAP